MCENRFITEISIGGKKYKSIDDVELNTDDLITIDIDMVGTLKPKEITLNTLLGKIKFKEV